MTRPPTERPPKARLPGLVIFDCDGVLVDSEVLSMAVTRDVLSRAGCPLSEEDGYHHLLGRSLSTLVTWLRDERGLALDEDHLAAMRAQLYARFRAELRPIPGIAQAIRDLPCPVCVASSSAPERIALSLEVTGLIDLFDGNLFSATMVSRGKPAPDLFLFAAAQMGVDPADCVVIEDSPAGIEAAQAAGMRVVAFTGGSHAKPAGLQETVEKRAPDAILSRMEALPPLLAGGFKAQ